MVRLFVVEQTCPRREMQKMGFEFYVPEAQGGAGQRRAGNFDSSPRCERGVKPGGVID